MREARRLGHGARGPRAQQHTIDARLSEEESRIRHEGGAAADDLMKRRFAECQAKLGQSHHEKVRVVLWTADGTFIEAFDDGDQLVTDSSPGQRFGEAVQR